MQTLLARRNTIAGVIMTPISASRLGPKAVTKEDAAVGERVRSMRVERKMSQVALADALGVTFQQVQKYEKGVNRISGARIMLIASAFECPTSAILCTSETQAEQSLGDRMTATRKGCRIALACLALDNDATDMIVNLAEWLLEVQGRKL